MLAAVAVGGPRLSVRRAHNGIVTCARQHLESGAGDARAGVGMAAGYSHRRAAEKLGVKAGSCPGVIDADEGWDLDGMPEDVVVRTSLRGGRDVTIAFVRSRRHLKRNAQRYERSLEGRRSLVDRLAPQGGGARERRDRGPPSGGSPPARPRRRQGCSDRPRLVWPEVRPAQGTSDTVRPGPSVCPLPWLCASGVGSLPAHNEHEALSRRVRVGGSTVLLAEEGGRGA